MSDLEVQLYLGGSGIHSTSDSKQLREQTFRQCSVTVPLRTFQQVGRSPEQTLQHTTPCSASALLPWFLLTNVVDVTVMETKQYPLNPSHGLHPANAHRINFT